MSCLGVMHGYGRFEWVTGDVYNGDFCEVR